MDNSQSMLGESKWEREHTQVFISTSLGFLMWGFVTTMGIASLSWFKGEMPAYMIPVYPALGPLALLIGNQAMGRLADRVGRKRVFIATMILYAVGLLLMAVAINLPEFVAAYLMAEFGVGGEEPASLSALMELMPSNERGKALVLSTNFDNIGAALASGIILAAGLYSINFNQARLLLGIAGAAVIAVAAIARHSMPESTKWLEARQRNKSGKGDGAMVRSGPSLWFRLAVLGIIGASQIVTYGLIAFYLAYYYYTSTITISEIIMMANLGAAAAGLVGFAVDKIGRKEFMAIAYIGGALSMIPIILFYNSLGNYVMFYSFLFINMAFSEFGWAVRTMLEPELFRTVERATFIGLVRVIAWSIYILTIYLSFYLNEYYYLVMNLIFYAMGAGGAIAWLAAGIETRGVRLDDLEDML